ncbi:hypothetical protein Hamer_G003096, partial [Homarus americanus]
MKGVPLAKKADLLLLGIYLIYENSSLNRSMLKRAREICRLPFLVPTRHIQNPNDSAYHKGSSRKAKNYPMLLTSADVIKYIHLLLDILHYLGCLSQQFQHRQTNVFASMNEIQVSVDLLIKYLTSPGRFWKVTLPYSKERSWVIEIL